MSRALLLLPSVPRPLDAGARIRNAGLLHALRTEYEVDVLAFGDTAPPPSRPLARRVIDMAQSDLPDMAQRLWARTFADAVCRQLRQHTYDVVQAEGIEMARYLWLVPNQKRVYDAHNAEFLLQRRLASSTSLVAGAYSRLQWRRLERFEAAVVRESRLTLAVSEHDANQLIALAGAPANVRVVPNAINVASYDFRVPGDQVPRNLLYVGKLDFRPNADALAWFIPEVLRRVEDARLFALGAAPPRWLVAEGQHDPHVAVTGYVDDEHSYLRRCAALVLPVRTGGGSRLKALVAMASGLPIVSTRVGMEGLDAEPGTHYLQAESAAEWVFTLNRVLADAQLRRGLACNARALVEKRYDWSAMADRLRAAYATIRV